MAVNNMCVSSDQALVSPNSKKQIELCLVKLKTPTSPKKLTNTSMDMASSSPPNSVSCTDSQTLNLLDLRNEDPLKNMSSLQFSQSQNSSGRSKQTDLLSFLNQSRSKRSPNELTPLMQHTNKNESIKITKSSRALFLSPQLQENKQRRKRKCLGSPGDKPRVSKRRRKKENMDQLQLDCGQKLLGHVTCKVCGMVYTHNQLDDQVEHSRFHARFVTGVNFPGWKREIVVAILDIGRVIMVSPSDSKQHSKKMEDIQSLVDHELGYSVSLEQRKSRQFTVFLCVAQRKVMGCAFIERITQGFEVLSDMSSSFDSLTAWYSSTEPQPAVLGINRLWVAANCRRMGVASKLLDAARSNLSPGCVVPKDKIAFTDPTPDGKMFASRYCGRTNFLVYR